MKIRYFQQFQDSETLVRLIAIDTGNTFLPVQQYEDNVWIQGKRYLILSREWVMPDKNPIKSEDYEVDVIVELNPPTVNLRLIES